MVRKTMKMLVVALIAAFALSSMAEAASKMTRHRAKHSSRVASGAPAADAATGKKPAVKKKAPAVKSRSRAQSSKPGQKAPMKKAPAKRRPTTKPR